MQIPKISNLSKPYKTIILLYVALVLSVLLVAGLQVAAHHGLIGASTPYNHMGKSGSSMSGKKQSYAIAGEGGQSMAIEVETENIGNVVKVQSETFNHDNFRIAHAHINGQTLLTFTIYALLFFCGSFTKLRFPVSLGLALGVILHFLGLAFRHIDELFILLVVGGSIYMLFGFIACVMVLADIVKKPEV